jgi:LmbE family N-acetylglucosaminyl deacetylase
MRVRDIARAADYAHVVLSPHLDDAVLSLGGTIAELSSKGERVLVYNVCSGLPSPLDELSPIADELTGGSAHGWVKMRRAEDELACALIGADHYFDTARDAIFRDPDRYATFDSLFEPPDLSDSLSRRAFGTFTLLLTRAWRAKFYAPLAIGGHADHRIVCAAAMRALPRERLFFYEDFPYVLGKNSRKKRFGELKKEGHRFAAVNTKEIDPKIKTRAIGAYSSQLAMLFGSTKKMVRAIESHREETIWRAITPRL